MRWGPADASTVLVFAAGDDGRADDPVATALGASLAGRGVGMLALEAPARGEGSDALVAAQLREAVAHVEATRVVVGGFSRGARVAAMLAASLGAVGVVAVSYPFHPRRDPRPGERLDVLMHASVPVLVCQGTRDALGNREQVRGYRLPASVEVVWLEDGNHGLVPRARSGRTHAELVATAAEAVARFVGGLG